KTGNRSRRAKLADEIDVANVDAQFERCSRNEGTQFTGFESLFGGQALFASEAAVMRGDIFIAKPFTQVARDALGQTACVYEDERRVMLADQFSKTIVNLFPNLAGHHC